MCVIAAESISQYDTDIVIYVTSLATNAKSSLVIYLADSVSLRPLNHIGI